MNQARVFKAKIRSGEYRTQEDMDKMRTWAREARHRIEARDWRVETPVETPVELGPE